MEHWKKCKLKIEKCKLKIGKPANLAIEADEFVIKLAQ